MGGWSTAVEEAIEGERTGYVPKPLTTRYFEDVHDGDQLPTLVMPITMTRCVYLASATRDFSPQHSNPNYARKRSKTKDVFVNTPWNFGMVGRYLTDWMGTDGFIRRIKIKMRENVCAGDDMIIDGKVTRIYLEGVEHLADIDIMISTQQGPATPCSATVVLPSRRNAAG